ncbi:hypothetical protein jhhlp_004440 [Lomentospora prolificans]|uniref:Putative phospholipase n=1 Tax=Lomentospora prolificans TaxID=41688 RepID=A0A2N3NBQ3_9PEZI|nr:hypothetical protein jhhlp_004440 [Lomentospora prolificans]
MLSSLNPVPGFPDYTGPYKVGTVDVEIPVSDLHAPSPRPDNADHILSVAFRIFYPASLESKNRGDKATWLPMPQRQHISSYTKFVGAGPVLAEVLSYLPRHLHYTSIPAYKNADILPANTPNGRWPTVIFSHGLGGSRNAYSHVAGSLASHGTVVICPEHRDGSAVTSFIRNPEKHRQLQEQKRSSSPRPTRFFARSASNPKNVVVPYRRISHNVSPEMYAAREEQLRVRMWEMGLVHEAVLSLDRGDKVTNMNVSTLSLDPFVGMMHVHEPGSIIFAGHSFGSATTVQFVKSTYYADHPALRQMDKAPLFTPEPGSEIRRQITEKTATILLDIWVTPLIDPGFTPLFNLPMPAYADTPDAPGGKAILSVLSDQFYKWEEHLRATARVLSPCPAHEVQSAELYKRSDPSLPPFPEPNFFYVQESAHLSQSDFGILFPWLTKKMFSAVEPERAIRLNLRAQLQFLRENGVPVARTCGMDLADGVSADAVFVEESSEKNKQKKKGGKGDLVDDRAILDKSGEGLVDHWVWIDSVALFAGSDSESESVEGTDKNKRRVERTDRDMAEHLEPGLEEAAVVSSRG